MKQESNINRGRFENSGDGPLKSGGRSFSFVLQEIVQHLTEIIRSEVRLARTEVRQDVTKVARAGVFLAIGAVFALFGLGFILLGAVYALASTMPSWAAALTVGVGVAIVAAIFIQVGRARMKRTSLRPDETIRSLQENVTWMKKQTK